VSGAADLVARLAEAGTPPALLGAVAEALFAAEAERRILDGRRRSERDRKARSRAPSRDTAGAQPADGDRTGPDETGPDAADRDGTARDLPAEAVTGPSPDKSPPHPQKLTPNPCVRGSRARRGYHRLPEGWTPERPLPAETRAKVDQWPPGALEDELAALHRWAANAKNEAGRGRKLDWDKAWVNWIERRHDEHFRRIGSGAEGARRHQAGDGLSATTRAANRVFGPAGAGIEPPLPR
jgi:hypothetical protein